MIPVIVILLIIPVIGLILFLLKTILKLSFSVVKILVVLFVLWLLYGFITGGIQETLKNIGKPSITTQEDGSGLYLGAFTKGELDVEPYILDKIGNVEVDVAFSDVYVKMPENCVLKIEAQAVFCNIEVEGHKQSISYGSKQFVTGTGENIVTMKLRSAFSTVHVIP